MDKTAAFFAIGVLYGLSLVLIVALKAREIRRRDREIALMQRKIDALLQHAGIVFEPYPGLDAAVQAALSRGRKIEAIRLYRQASGVGLAAAKATIEERMRLTRPP